MSSSIYNSNDKQPKKTYRCPGMGQSSTLGGTLSLAPSGRRHGATFAKRNPKLCNTMKLNSQHRVANRMTAYLRMHSRNPSIARSFRGYNEDNVSHIARSQAPTPSSKKKLSPSQPCPPQPMQKCHQPEEDDSSNGIVILLGLSLTLLSFPWLWSHPESLFIFPLLLLVLPFTGNLLTSALGGILHSLVGWAAGGSGLQKSRTVPVRRDEARMSSALPHTPDMVDRQAWQSDMARYGARLQPVTISEDFVQPSETALPTRARAHKNSGSIHHNDQLHRSSSLPAGGAYVPVGGASGESLSLWRRSLVAVAPFLKDWGGFL